jgi:hypothetical protein
MIHACHLPRPKRALGLIVYAEINQHLEMTRFVMLVSRPCRNNPFISKKSLLQTRFIDGAILVDFTGECAP